MSPTKPTKRRSRTAAPGFTLIEASLTTVILGVGVVAMVEAQQAFLRSNLWSSQAATGAYLAGELRELMRPLSRHDPVSGLTLLDDGGGGSTLEGWGPDAGELGLLDFDDIDDFDGLTLTWFGTGDWADGDLPGPVDAAGRIIPEIDTDGQPVPGPQGESLPLQNWTQRVTVVKVDPFDTSTVLADNAMEPAGLTDGRPVDRYPLRVTVEVDYQGPFDPEPLNMARLSWIVP